MIHSLLVIQELGRAFYMDFFKRLSKSRKQDVAVIIMGIVLVLLAKLLKWQMDRQYRIMWLKRWSQQPHNPEQFLGPSVNSVPDAWIWLPQQGETFFDLKGVSVYSKVLVALDNSEASKRAAEKDEFVSHVLSNCAEEAQQIFRPLEKKSKNSGQDAYLKHLVATRPKRYLPRRRRKRSIS